MRSISLKLTRLSEVYQCVPNFSEGRRSEVVAEIAQAMRNDPEAELIDYSNDADHNRCVMTLLGSADGIARTIQAAADVAFARIDLRDHQGAHPRIGALDVLPIVPLKGVSREQAIVLARRLGETLAARYHSPVFFYEWNAAPGRLTELPDLRRGEFEGLQRKGELIGAAAPDCGPCRAHPTFGAMIVGARAPLVAWNIMLDTPSLGTARSIAKVIRRERRHLPELMGVRALGLALPRQGLTQVSMNVTRADQTPLPPIREFVCRQAKEFSCRCLESEIIGAVSRAALGGLSPEELYWKGYRPEQILENWLNPDYDQK